MNNSRMLILAGTFIFLLALLGGQASAEFYKDDDAGYSITYDEQAWVIEDMGIMFGDISGYDDKLVSKPLALVDYDQEVATIFVVVSERDDYMKDMLAFIEDSMGKLAAKDIIYEADDTFTDSAGNAFDSHVKAWSIAPEYEDPGIFLSQVFFDGGKRYEICFLAMPDNFTGIWDTAKGIMDSIAIG